MARGLSGKWGSEGWGSAGSLYPLMAWAARFSPFVELGCREVSEVPEACHMVGLLLPPPRCLSGPQGGPRAHLAVGPNFPLGSRSPDRELSAASASTGWRLLVSWFYFLFQLQSTDVHISSTHSYWNLDGVTLGLGRVHRRASHEEEW